MTKEERHQRKRDINDIRRDKTERVLVSDYMEDVRLVVESQTEDSLCWMLLTMTLTGSFSLRPNTKYLI